jgi:anti-anti-sigma regulatory factor
MATPRSIVSVCQEGTILFCRVEGWGTMTHGLAFRQHAEACLELGVTALRIDLQHCDYMDSTFLGTLVCLSRTFGRRAPEGFGLVRPSARCQELLAKMKLDAVLPVRGANLPPGSWIELYCSRDEAGFQTCVVQAHQELASLPGPTGDSFHKVAAALTNELEAKEKH